MLIEGDRNQQRYPASGAQTGHLSLTPLAAKMRSLENTAAYSQTLKMVPYNPKILSLNITLLCINNVYRITEQVKTKKTRNIKPNKQPVTNKTENTGIYHINLAAANICSLTS